LANYTAREILKTEEGLKLTSREIEERAKVARAAALDAVENTDSSALACTQQASRKKQASGKINMTTGVRKRDYGKWVSVQNMCITQSF